MASTTKPGFYLEGDDRVIASTRYVLLTGACSDLRSSSLPVTLLLNGNIRVGSKVRQGASWSFGGHYMRERLLPGELPVVFDKQLTVLKKQDTHFPRGQTLGIAAEEEAIPRETVTVSIPGWRVGREGPYGSSFVFDAPRFAPVHIKGVAFAKATQHQRYIDEECSVSGDAFRAVESIRDWAMVWLQCTSPNPSHVRQAACVNFTDSGYSTVFCADYTADNTGLHWSWRTPESAVSNMVHYYNPKLSAELLLWGCTTS